jgi:NADPH2:quinone reductase
VKAVICSRLGDPSGLVLGEWPSRAPDAGEVRVALHGGGVNFTDLMVIGGTYQRRYDPPFVLGTEGAGVVLECGPEVNGFSPGDRVVVQNNIARGCFADEVTAPASRLCAVPDEVPLLAAAGFPVSYGTSYYALATRARLQRAEVLVVHGASGGVGVAAVQLGKALGARVIATGGDDAKLAEVARLGADHVINIRTGDLREGVLELTQGRGADVVLDTVGGDVFEASMGSIAVDGRLLIVGFVSGRIPRVAVNRILFKGISVVGVPYGGFTQRNPVEWARNMSTLLRMVSEGALQPRIHAYRPLSAAAEVLRELGERRVLGKCVLYTDAGGRELRERPLSTSRIIPA